MRGSPQKALAFISRYIRETGGVSPGVRDVRDGIGLKSTGQTLEVLDELESRGDIRRVPYRKRGIEVLRPIRYTLYHPGNADFFAWDDAAKALRPRG